MSNEWNRNSSPPPPTFLNQPERDFQKQVADEVIERVIGQQIMYFPVDLMSTNVHPIYGESINKVYLKPIRIYALIEYEDNDSKTTNFGIDRRSKIIVHFHNRRIREDQELWVREGDIIFYNNEYHEIIKLFEPDEMFGQIDFKVQISAHCVKSRNPPQLSESTITSKSRQYSLIISSTTPTNGAFISDVSSDIQIVFNFGINSSTSSGNVILEDSSGNSVDFIIVWSSNYQTMYVNPLNDLIANETFILTIKTGLKALNGASLTQNYTLVFFTASAEDEIINRVFTV